MVISMYRDDVPEWVCDNWLTTCPECGSFIVDNSDTGVTTSRSCANPICPGHMSYKADMLAKRFNIKGFGPKTARSIISRKQMKSHLEFLKEWFPDDTMTVSLAEVADMCMLEGYGMTTAEKELSQYRSFDQYFAECKAINPILAEHKEELLYAQTLFRIKEPLAASKIYVMATGTFNGYSNRMDFFKDINELYGWFIHVIVTGKRKTGIHYLVCEKDASDSSKLRTARDCGIPIVTPAEFLSIIKGNLPYNNEGI